jgi:hypothetical protein
MVVQCMSGKALVVVTVQGCNFPRVRLHVDGVPDQVCGISTFGQQAELQCKVLQTSTAQGAQGQSKKAFLHVH